MKVIFQLFFSLLFGAVISILNLLFTIEVYTKINGYDPGPGGYIFIFLMTITFPIYLCTFYYMVDKLKKRNKSSFKNFFWRWILIFLLIFISIAFLSIFLIDHP